MLRLEGKVALVTGCGSCGPGWGNGQAIAVRWRGRAPVSAWMSIRWRPVTAARIGEEGGIVCIEQVDVTSEAAVRGMVGDCLARFGRIDILVNNVGRSEPGGPEEMSSEVWAEQLQLNLTSAYLSCKYVLPRMKEASAGSIVNVSSVAGLRYVGKPQVAYAAAKAALAQFTRTTAVIYAPHGVRLNCVVLTDVHAVGAAARGQIRTGRFRRLRRAPSSPGADGAYGRRLGRRPYGAVPG